MHKLRATYKNPVVGKKKPLALTSNTWPQLQVQGEPLMMGNGLASQASVTSARSFYDSLKRETLVTTQGQVQIWAILASWPRKNP